VQCLVNKRRVKRKRSKALVFMLLPALIFIGFMGWLMYAMEPQRRAPQKSTQHDAAKKDDGISFLPAIGEETEEITNQ
jgi:hypothetical protein